MIRTDGTIRSYLITDPAFYGTTPRSLFETTVASLGKHHPDFACFRDKTSADYAVLAAAFVEAVRQEGSAMAMLHGDPELAARLGADGVHLPSNAYKAIPDAKRLGLYTVASCHSCGELETAAGLGADAATYSPVFASPGKGIPKGLEDLKEIVGKIDLNIFALGGITTPEQIGQVAATGAYGFASIRYFL